MKLDHQKWSKHTIVAMTIVLVGFLLLLAFAIAAKLHTQSQRQIPNVLGQGMPGTAGNEKVTPSMPSVPKVSPRDFSVCPSPDITSGTTIAMKSDLTSSVPSAHVGFYASVINHNSTQAHDGIVLVRISKKGNGNEPDRVIDSFVGQKGVEVAPNRAVQSTFVWTVPADASGGDYYIEAQYVFPGRPYVAPLITRTRTDASVIKMPIISPVQTSVYIDDKQTQVNGVHSTSDYIFARASTTPITVTVVNNTDVPYQGNIAWKLYEKAEAPLGVPAAQTDQLVLAHPHSKVVENYTLPVVNGDVYYLEAHLSSKMGSQSVIGIPLVRQGSCQASVFGGRNWMSVTIEILLAFLIFGGVAYFTRAKWQKYLRY